MKEEEEELTGIDDPVLEAPIRLVDKALLMPSVDDLLDDEDVGIA